MISYHKTLITPVGELILTCNDHSLSGVQWQKSDSAKSADSIYAPDNPLLLETEEQLAEYFEGRRTSFKLPLEFTGTAFQKNAWEIMLTIPYGQTRSYGWLAKQMMNPGSVRAIGGAMNKNPIPIIAPCHRVIGISGDLTGFGAGLENKSILLRLEGQKHAPTLF